MLISIVVPCFNEEEVLPETIERLCRVTDKIKTANLVRLQNFTLETEILQDLEYLAEVDL